MNKYRVCFFVFAICLALSTPGMAQIGFLGGGVDAGLGSFSSSAPSVTSYLASAYVDLKYYALPNIYFKPQIFYARDVNILLPEDRTGKYYPYIYGAALSAISGDSLSASWTLEYGGGVVILKDKTFGDLENFSPGAQLNASLLLTVKEYAVSKLQIGATVFYGQTFGKTTPGYFFYAIDCRLRMK